MANLNKVMLIGRLTRKPEPITVRGSTAGCKFGFAVNNRRPNGQGGWEDVPVFIDCEIWNRGEGGTQAKRALDTLRGPDREAGIKASQVYLEGHLRFDTWEDREGGAKRSKLVLVVDSFQYLDPRDGAEPGPPPSVYRGVAERTAASPPPAVAEVKSPVPVGEQVRAAPGKDDIPF